MIETGVVISGVGKAFGGTRVLDDVSLDVRRGEFLSVLGPSGCGKTTLLRLLAGFETVGSGSIAIDDRLVSAPGLHLPPEARRIGIVFQSYALWPHMNVAENVGYALKIAGFGADDRRRRIASALDTVDLAGFGERRPADLSGGQRQRVALARCLVTSPSLVLLDEPLANLDVHLRAAMEDAFTEFHRRTGTTMIYVTHDQAEAMALADRIAVLDRGRLVQIAEPRRLYREPASAMVAGFVGGGQVVEGEVAGTPEAGRVAVRLFEAEWHLRCAPGETRRPGAAICLRPRDLVLAPHGGVGLAVRLGRVVYRGSHTRVEASPVIRPDLRLVVETTDHDAVREGDVARLVVRDGWVVPASSTDASASAESLPPNLSRRSA